jgi:Holliday junction resolvase
VPNANYNRGAAFERRVKVFFEAEGWYAIRAAGSKGAADVVALRFGRRPALIACRPITNKPNPEEMARLEKCAEIADAYPLVALSRGRKPWLLLVNGDPLSEPSIFTRQDALFP